MIRQPAVAGSFYDMNPLEQIERSFLEGPGKLQERTDRKFTENHSLISPHAGYVYSGKCAAYGFYEIAKRGVPENIVIVGPNHTGMGNNAFTTEDFMTPLGVARTNTDLIKVLSVKTSIPIDPMPHRYEHSIEVQIPFLQYIYNEMPPIIPLVIGIADWKKIGDAIGETLKNSLIIASSDFMHYGPRFGYMPEDPLGMDDKAFSFLEKADPDAFIEYCDSTGITICGRYPIAIMMEALRRPMKKLCHYNSNDIVKDENFVDYISAIDH